MVLVDSFRKPKMNPLLLVVLSPWENSFLSFVGFLSLLNLFFRVCFPVVSGSIFFRVDFLHVLCLYLRGLYVTAVSLFPWMFLAHLSCTCVLFRQIFCVCLLFVSQWSLRFSCSRSVFFFFVRCFLALFFSHLSIVLSEFFLELFVSVWLFLIQVSVFVFLFSHLSVVSSLIWNWSRFDAC